MAANWGGWGSDFPLADVENPLVLTFPHVRLLCHHDSDFPVFLRFL